MDRKPPLLVVTGPTASGKTTFALELMRRLRKFGFAPEMVNADSVQMYREFDIGAAKPDESQLNEFPSHLFSVLDPPATVDVAQFQTLADDAISRIHARGGLPVVVGGTGLYIQVLLNGIFRYSYAASGAPDSEGVVSEPIWRRDIPENQNEIDWRNRLYQELLEIDAYTAEQLSPSDVVRVRRALHVFKTAGVPLRKLQEDHAYAERRYAALVLVLEPERESLYATIDRRVDEMIRGGLVDEVRGIVERYGDKLHALGALGYRHALQIEAGMFDRDRGVDLMRRDTRRYAKRQLTWWRNQPRKLGWIEAANSNGEQSKIMSSQNAQIQMSVTTNAAPKEKSEVFSSVVLDSACDIIRSFMQADAPFEKTEIYFTPIHFDPTAAVILAGELPTE